MAKITEYRDIPLVDLVIGKAQARVKSAHKGIGDLALSIKAQGLLQPIVVCASEDDGKWEILAGQRRFLAHQHLGVESIAAAVIDERVSEGEAKAISITENLIRRQLSSKERKDGILFLYNLYGTQKDVQEATGLSQKIVSDNVKYPRLIPELKAMVDEGKVDIHSAVRAQDAATDQNYEVNAEDALVLAQEMMPMSDAQRKKVVKDRQERPEKPVEEVIEDAKSGAQIIQVVATITLNVHVALQKFAKDEGRLQDEAAAALIEEALVGRGLLDE